MWVSICPIFENINLFELKKRAEKREKKAFHMRYLSTKMFLSPFSSVVLSAVTFSEQGFTKRWGATRGA